MSSNATFKSVVLIAALCATVAQAAPRNGLTKACAHKIAQAALEDAGKQLSSNDKLTTSEVELNDDEVPNVYSVEVMTDDDYHMDYLVTIEPDSCQIKNVELTDSAF